MHIYTHGNAEYAVEMARLLDPTRKYFAERIISQVCGSLLHDSTQMCSVQRNRNRGASGQSPSWTLAFEGALRRFAWDRVKGPLAGLCRGTARRARCA